MRMSKVRLKVFLETTTVQSRMCVRLIGVLILLFVSASCKKQKEGQAEAETKVTQTIHLSENGDISLDGRLVEIENLAAALSVTSPVRITAEGKVRTELLVSVINECKKAGIRNAVIDYGNGLVVPIRFESPAGSER